MLSVLKLNSPEGLKKYQQLLQSLDINEPYYLLDYITVFSNGLDDLICFFFESDHSKATVFMTGHLKKISIGGNSTDYFDFITPYGYTGPIFSKNIKNLEIEKFWQSVDQWYLKNNVITEFIRFNLSGNQELYSGDTFSTMLNIKGKIIDEEIQWKAFDHKVRKNVNKAKKENLSSTIYYHSIEPANILEFYTIYIETMKRTNANAKFFYSLSNFTKFIIDNKDYVSICTIYYENIAISSELLLVSDDTIYSFLGGTDDKYFDKRPNDFLKVEALNWGRSQGKKYYVLGGGYGFEDGIFKYKKAFFPTDVVEYYTGRKILRPDIYDQLVEEASKLREKGGLEKLDKTDSSFFPLYNKL
ncbi:GNAT family N-acetyltransferase [Flavobacterium sp. P4023]|uniref:GNAT family N-acetyltransferase n=1 Tax=Flavobacterium flabelliforme TaxID=2816119 RepID=A0ABS5CSB7_9FLAO|nr:GNAT family N-acetyltransferase [Flavobacterium flabelliforme]MBP4141520.1 GNAT family N-acetyltransferase [Flavobacterium flabelliforme]